MTPDTYDHITFNNWSYVSGVIRLGFQPSRMTPDTYDHRSNTSGRMYQVPYGWAIRFVIDGITRAWFIGRMYQVSYG